MINNIFYWAGVTVLGLLIFALIGLLVLLCWQIYSTIIEGYAKRNGVGNRLDQLMRWLRCEVKNEGQVIYLGYKHKNKDKILKLLEE